MDTSRALLYIALVLLGLAGLASSLLQCNNPNNGVQVDHPGVYLIANLTESQLPRSENRTLIYVDFSVQYPWDTTWLPCHGKGTVDSIWSASITGSCTQLDSPVMGQVNSTFQWNLYRPDRPLYRHLEMDVSWFCNNTDINRVSDRP
jgi:hypothetical protein